MNCKDCKYFRKLKHNFKVGKGYKESYGCLALAVTEEDGFIVEVSPDGECEMFTSKLIYGDDGDVFD